MAELVNPLAAFREGYGLLEGMAQDQAMRTAGNALMGGDYGGARNALYARGMIDQGMGIQQYQDQQAARQQAQEAARMEAERKAAGERAGYLLDATEALRRLPPEQRKAVLETQIIPTLRTMPGFDDEVLGAISASDLSDQTLDTFGAMLGAEADKYQIVVTRSGDVLAVNPQNPGDRQVIVDAPDEEREAPIGYRFRPDGSLEAIPGGPADPGVAGRLAGAKRAPRAPRGAPSTLPSGFVLDP
ncbi:MAG: hypothetical protein ACOY4K_00590 [Pseudomonadota bacterium]